MTKRELLRQARHVLGPGAVVEIERKNRVHWVARAFAVNHGVMAGGISRDQAVSRANAMLVDLDVSGWRWEEA